MDTKKQQKHWPTKLKIDHTKKTHHHLHRYHAVRNFMGKYSTPNRVHLFVIACPYTEETIQPWIICSSQPALLPVKTNKVKHILCLQKCTYRGTIPIVIPIVQIAIPHCWMDFILQQFSSQAATKMEEHAMAEPQKLGGNQRPQGAPTPAANGRPSHHDTF